MSTITPAFIPLSPIATRTSQVHSVASQHPRFRIAPKCTMSDTPSKPAVDMSKQMEIEPVEVPTLLHCMVVRNAAEAIEWYKKALNAKLLARYDDDNGRVMHSILETGFGVRIAVEDHYKDMHMVKPVAEGETQQDVAAGGMSYVYITVPKGKGTADEWIERMRKMGGEVVMEAGDKFYGHRMGQIVDVYGQGWAFGHVLDK